MVERTGPAGRPADPWAHNFVAALRRFERDSDAALAALLVDDAVTSRLRTYHDPAVFMLVPAVTV